MWKATLFHIAIDDLIQFAGNSYVQVPGTTVSKGIEIAGEAEINPFLRIYGPTPIPTRNDGQQRVPSPRHDAVLGLQADLAPRLQGRFDVRHVADVRASSFAPVDNKVGDYTLVGTGLSYAVTDDTTAYTCASRTSLTRITRPRAGSTPRVAPPMRVCAPRSSQRGSAAPGSASRTDPHPYIQEPSQ